MNDKIKIVTVIGARPQFIKASSLSRELNKYNDINEIIIHTGQHFDKNMSDIFFEEMKIPKPKYNLGISSSYHGDMTGKMIIEIEKILLLEKPRLIILYGDTNSTLAGALAAKKLNIKIAHIEAGLRSYNQKMPEEINRVLTDRVSDFLFCPTINAVNNLYKEGFNKNDLVIENVGDIMYDSFEFYKSHNIKPKFTLPKKFILATIHRAENTNKKNLKKIISALNKIHKSCFVVVPLHPRTKKLLDTFDMSVEFQIIEPVGYLEMLWLIQHSKLIMTDSGGLQKEAYFAKKFCITLRNETEWIELVQCGYNKIVGANKEKIINSYENHKDVKISNKHFYGDGKAAYKIVRMLRKYMKKI